MKTSQSKLERAPLSEAWKHEANDSHRGWLTQRLAMMDQVLRPLPYRARPSHTHAPLLPL